MMTVTKSALAIATVAMLVLLYVTAMVAHSAGYRSGAQDASCYALLAAGPAAGALPLDMAPCPPDRRPVG